MDTTNLIQKKERIEYIDLMKGICIIRHYKIFCVNGKYGIQV